MFLRDGEVLPFTQGGGEKVNEEKLTWGGNSIWEGSNGIPALANHEVLFLTEG